MKVPGRKVNVKNEMVAIDKLSAWVDTAIRLEVRLSCWAILLNVWESFVSSFNAKTEASLHYTTLISFWIRA